MTTTDAPADRRYRVAGLAVAAAAVAAVIGAYVDWIWWPVSSGLMLTIIALAILLVGGIAAVLGRGMIRTGALIGVAAGIGLLLGQNLGPSREELLVLEGTMTLTLTSPVAASGSAPASCSVVASGTEYSISGDPNMRLETPDRPFVSAYVTKGDRWLVAAPERPRHEDITLSIDLTPVEVPADGTPSMTSMAADADSTIQATFTGAGGSITFAGLAPQAGIDVTGESIDLEGTLEWTCDAP